MLIWMNSGRPVLKGLQIRKLSGLGRSQDEAKD